jgi:hypothetical protein
MEETPFTPPSSEPASTLNSDELRALSRLLMALQGGPGHHPTTAGVRAALKSLTPLCADLKKVWDVLRAKPPYRIERLPPWEAVNPDLPDQADELI